jgi:hypothetical protein
MHELDTGSSTTPGLIGSHHLCAVNFGFRNGAVRSLKSPLSLAYGSFDYSVKAVFEWFQRMLRGTNTDKRYGW